MRKFESDAHSYLKFWVLIDVFLELSCFFDDPVDVGNLISGSSAFSIPQPGALGP